MSEIFIRTRIAPGETKDVPLKLGQGTTDITALYLNITSEIPQVNTGKFEEGLILLFAGDALGTPPYDAGIISRMPNRTLIFEEPVRLDPGVSKWNTRFMNQSTFILTLDLVLYCTKQKEGTGAVPMFKLSELNLLANKTEIPTKRVPEKKAGP